MAGMANFFTGKTLAANRGKGFEEEIIQTHAYYQRMELAWVFRLHVRTAARGGVTVYLEKTACDYMGYLPLGRAVLIEANSLANPATKRWRPDRPHQLQAIQRANKAGALGFYLIRLGLDEVKVWKPPGDYQDGPVMLGELPSISRSYKECIWDWLPLS
jgi:penicillin-binding protein-related factor A (putative recombinase)